jgi:hypothetical protein
LEQKMEQCVNMTSQKESLTRCLYDARYLFEILPFHQTRSGWPCRASRCSQADIERLAAEMQQ